MKADDRLKNLEKVLSDLKTKKNLGFNDVCDLLFIF